MMYFQVRLEVNQLKKVKIEDLLGREPVELDMAMISRQLTNQTILVTAQVVRLDQKFVDRYVSLIQSALYY